ncbi:MAG: beta-galactosidase [Clostridia bacterium]|nr:beta-galactosidase [Clostridia bacterium]
MQYGLPEYYINMARAARLEEPTKTITVLMDSRPDFDPDSARNLICAMMEMGYLVQEVTVKEFLSKNVGELGFLVVLPHAQSVPAMCAEHLETYWKQGGRVLVLGGRLFGHLIETGENGFESVPLKAEELEQTAIDAATSGKMYPIVMEGFTPSYKVYNVPHISSFMREDDQSIVCGTITATDEDLFCPQARQHGHGYGMGHLHRFIPMIQAIGEGGRAEGRRGAAVYAMLSDVVCRPHYFVDENRLGYVKGTNRGGCAVGIGFTRQDILNIDGMRDVLEELLCMLQRGLFLFEAGSDRFVAKAHETIKLGTKVMNLTMDYYPVRVEFRVRRGDNLVFTAVREELAVTANFTDIAVEFEAPENGEYTVETVLFYDNTVIDRIKHTFAVDEPYVGKPEEFVKVEDGEFMLGGKQWRAFGINYWPLYSTGFEWNDYWWGWLDKAYYDPLEIERDLALLEDMGLNCLFTRLDGDPIGRCEDTMKDFIRRCRRHGLRLMFSYCNATSPLNYQGLPFRRFMEDTGLISDPTLFAHDIGWEMGGKFYAIRKFVNMRDKAWENWLIERYGSIENAEKDFGVSVDRTEYGQVIAPSFEQIMGEGDWRIKVRAYKRFTIDFVSRKWHDATEDMRKTDPNHLITCRTGGILRCSIALNCAVKYLDFTTPEGWQTPSDARGEYYAYVIPLVMKLFSGGKPTVWAEYGLSSCDLGWRNFIWDYENLAPYEWGVKQQTEWYKQFFETHKDADINGTAPWWFPGGLRYSERSDCGFCNPDGTLRPCAEIYKELGKAFKAPHEKYVPDYYVTLDEDLYSGSWKLLLWGEDKPGDVEKPRDLNGIRLTEEIRGVTLAAVQEARKNGKKVGFRTPGTETDSATMPMVAIGNVPLNGTNPPRYLNAEFNYLEVETESGERMQLANGAHIKAGSIRLRASVGNVQEATWLKPNGDEKGGVYLCADGPCTVRAAITADTAFLKDAQTEWVTLSGRGEYTLRMDATAVSSFGEIWRIVLE